jgi:hypothetical protein
MAKRVLDGAGIWLSDKLARIEPVWCRPEYTWIYPIASANGTFEHNLPKIFALCYCRRPDMTLEKLEIMFAAFEREKLIFKFFDKPSGLHWGFFTGSRKPGRLPSASRVQKGHEIVGPEPPEQELEKFLSQPARTETQPIKSQQPDREALSPVWAAIGALAPFGTVPFQESVEFYFANRGEQLLSDALEQAIQRCQKRKVPVPPQFFTMKRAIEEAEETSQAQLVGHAAASSLPTIRDIRPRER